MDVHREAVSFESVDVGQVGFSYNASQARVVFRCADSVSPEILVCGISYQI